MSGKSSKTKVWAVRITHTQYALMNSSKMMGRQSALARVLLSLYFNGKLNWIEPLISDEIKQANIEQKKHIGLKVERDKYLALGAKKEDLNGTNE
jgi:hypothetical protein